jgi:uncharacterized protein (TIGR00266 family)
MQYKIVGGSMQVLDINMSDGEKIFADSGKLVSKSENVTMTPRMAGGIIGAMQRKMTGATGMVTEFESKGDNGFVALAGLFPGKIMQVTLESDETFVAEDTAFLAREESVKFSVQFVNLGAAWFGGAGLILQKFTGPGNIFIHVVGDIVEYDLDGSTAWQVDPGHIAGFSGTLQYKITFVDNIRTAMFGGVGLFLAKFEGRGRVILHSVSRRKLAYDIYTIGAQMTKKK